MNHTRRKYYIILAAKKDNPKDIRGLCECSSGVDWQCGRVKLWISDDGNDYVGESLRKHFHKYVEQLEKNVTRYGGVYKKKYKQLKGKKTMLRKQMANHSCRNYQPCGRTRAEYQWNWVKHLSMCCGKYLRKQGYEIRAYRVGSKYCPIEIDFTERIAIGKNQLKWDKFKWRNPQYRIKQITI